MSLRRLSLACQVVMCVSCESHVSTHVKDKVVVGASPGRERGNSRACRLFVVPLGSDRHRAVVAVRPAPGPPRPASGWSPGVRSRPRTKGRDAGRAIDPTRYPPKQPRSDPTRSRTPRTTTSEPPRMHHCATAGTPRTTTYRRRGSYRAVPVRRSSEHGGSRASRGRRRAVSGRCARSARRAASPSGAGGGARARVTRRLCKMHISNS